MGPDGRDSPSGRELVGLSVFLAVVVLIPLMAGLALDSAIHTGPLFLLVGLVVGIAGAGGGVYMRFRRYL
jgi:F0F1-type ATP synthase assembly protein I